MSMSIPKAFFASALIGLSLLVPAGGQTGSSTPGGFAELVDLAYGQDQDLVNGMQYYNHHPKSIGNPYLLEGFVHQGAVSIRGVVYNGIWLRYNIFSQQVEVEYSTLYGADNQVVLVGDRVDYFRIGEYLFRNERLNGAEKQFYQVIGAGRMLCYISWYKQLIPVSNDSRFIEKFTTPKRRYLLEMDGNISKFQSYRDFIKLFPVSMKKDLRKLVRENHMQFRLATPEQLNLFLMAAARMLNEDMQ